MVRKGLICPRHQTHDGVSVSVHELTESLSNNTRCELWPYTKLAQYGCVHRVPPELMVSIFPWWSARSWVGIWRLKSPAIFRMICRLGTELSRSICQRGPNIRSILAIHFGCCLPHVGQPCLAAHVSSDMMSSLCSQRVLCYYCFDCRPLISCMIHYILYSSIWCPIIVDSNELLSFPIIIDFIVFYLHNPRVLAWSPSNEYWWFDPRLTGIAPSPTNQETEEATMGSLGSEWTSLWSISSWLQVEHPIFTVGSLEAG